MIDAQHLRAGAAIRFEGHTYRVAAAEYHPGQGKMGGVTHTRLKNLATGTWREHGFRAGLKLEDVPVDRQTLEFLYASGDQLWFMHPGNYEQTAVAEEVLGPQARLLSPGMRITIEFVDAQPAGAIFPDVVEARVEETAPAMHQQDGAWKPARLDNGVEVSVPQFIKTGDTIRIDTAQLKYVERAKAGGR